MKIGVVGSCYGELDRVYDAVRKLAKQGIAIDLLICCGDFMSVRDEKDLEHVAAPAHHKEDPKDFPKYFSGRSEAPVTTIFIGGKNEASNLLREHYYGGWVAPGIYYMGAAGVLRVGPLRIAGISGSFASGDYFRGRHECPPYTEEFKRSAFHAREWDAARLEKLQDPVDIVISYDWPRGIWKHGPYQKIIEQQDLGENLKREMEGNTLGSLAAMEVMKKLRPPFWFSASLQVRFPALVAHGDGTFTRFLALERCRGGKEFLQVLDIDPRWASALCRLPAPRWQRTEAVPSVVPLCYDAEWMALQKVNHQNISFSWHPEKARVAAPSKEDIRWIKERLKSICGVRPRPHGGRHPNLTPTKLRKSRGAGRQTFQKFSTLQLRELFEIRGMNFPGHLDKASMIHHLEEFDALHGGEDRFSKDPEECYPIPTGFLSTPSAQRGKILEMLELPDIWKDQEEHRRQLLRAASGADVVTYDPFSEAPDPLLENPAGKADADETDPGAITGRSPSPSTPTEEDDVTAPKVISTSREGPEAPLQEPEPEPRKDEGAVNNVNDMNGASEAMKHFLEMGLEGDEDEIGNDLKDPEVEIPETQVEEVALPSEDLAMEDNEEAEHLALADDLAKLEAEIALAEQLLNPCPQDPEEPEPAAELLGSVPMVPVTLESDEQPVISVNLEPTAEEAAELLAAAVMGLNDPEEPEDPEEDIDGGEVQLDCGPEHLLDLAEAVDEHLGDASTVADWTTPGGTEATGFAALALALEEADREEAESSALQVDVPRAPRKRRRF